MAPDASYAHAEERLFLGWGGFLYRATMYCVIFLWFLFFQTVLIRTLQSVRRGSPALRFLSWRCYRVWADSPRCFGREVGGDHRFRVFNRTDRSGRQALPCRAVLCCASHLLRPFSVSNSVATQRTSVSCAEPRFLGERVTLRPRCCWHCLPLLSTSRCLLSWGHILTNLSILRGTR